MEIENPIIVITLLLFIIIVFLVIKDSKNNDFITELKEINTGYQKSYNKLLHQKKSSEVRLGKIGENMAPFFNEWPYDPNSFRFLGNPVDGIQFTDDEIIFIEIKTGKSRLSNGQRRIRDLVSEGKVKFATFRVDDKGSTFKID